MCVRALTCVVCLFDLASPFFVCVAHVHTSCAFVSCVVCALEKKMEWNERNAALETTFAPSFRFLPYLIGSFSPASHAFVAVYTCGTYHRFPSFPGDFLSPSLGLQVKPSRDILDFHSLGGYCVLFLCFPSVLNFLRDALCVLRSTAY